MKDEVRLTPARSLCRRASPFAWELAYDQDISPAAGLLERGGHDAVAAVLLAREDDARIQDARLHFPSPWPSLRHLVLDPSGPGPTASAARPVLGQEDPGSVDAAEVQAQKNAVPGTLF